MDAQIGLESVTRERVLETLQCLLADEVALSIKTRNFHWNVEGPGFYQLHLLFEAQYHELDQLMDRVAERIRALGGYASGSMREFLKLTRVPEVSGATAPDPAVRQELLLLRDHELVIRETRNVVDALSEWDDAGTQEFVTGVLRQHEKLAWMLRALVARST